MNSPIKAVFAMAVALSAASGAAWAESTKVRLGMLPLALHQLPVMVAQENGYFADEGLEVEFTFFRGGSEVAPALINADIDVAQGVMAHPIKLLRKGLKTKILVLTQATPTFVLTVAKRHADIKDVADFKGRDFTFAIARRGSDSDMMMRSVLAWKELDPKSDVTLVAVPGYANHLVAMQQGDVDGAMILQPFAEIGRRKGDLEYLVDFAGGDGPVELRARPWTSLYVSDEFYAENREICARVVRAVVKGHKLIHDDLDAATAVALKYFPKYEEAVLKSVISGSLGAYSPEISEQRFKAENEYLLFGGIIDEAQSYDALVGKEMESLWAM